MDEADAYTIPEFCVRNKICRAYYYKLRPLGLAPDEMRVGSKVLISKEAAAVWRRKMETANSERLPLTTPQSQVDSHLDSGAAA